MSRKARSQPRRRMAEQDAELESDAERAEGERDGAHRAGGHPSAARMLTLPADERA